MNRNERWVVFLLGSAHTMVHFYEQAFPALLLTMAAYFHTRLETAVWMQTGLAFMFGLGALPAGFISDKFGPKRIVMVYLMGAAFSCIFISTAQSVTALAIGLAALGAFISLYHPAGTTLVTTQIKQVGKGLGYHGMGGGLGVAVAPVLAAALAVISPKYGWRLSFAAFGALGLLVAAGITTLKIPPQAPSEPGKRFWPEHLAKGSPRPLIIFLFIAILVGFCYRGMMTFLPTYFSKSLHGGIFIGSDLIKGGSFTTLALLVGIVGQFLGGHLATRFNLEKLYAVMLVITVPFLYMMSFMSNYALVLVTMIFALFYFSGQPIGNALIAEYTDQRGRGLGYGIYFAMAFGLGSFAAGFCGTIAANFGLSQVFAALAIIMFISFVLMMYLAIINKSSQNNLS